MKTITNNARGNNTASMLHLFTFDIYTLAGVFQETLYFTDFDIYVEYGGNEYTPISISFGSIKEDLSMQSNSVEITIDNINKELSNIALQYEWRNNPATITRVVFIPPVESPPDGEVYPYGYGDNLDIYPKITIDTYTKDVWSLFSGTIDSFKASEQSLTGTISTQFSFWKKPSPSRTYSQNEFNSIINAIVESVYWGRVDPDA